MSYDKDCVESVLRDNPETEKGEAIAICRAQQAAESGDIYDLQHTEFEADELELLAEAEVVSQATVGDDIVWVTQDADIAIAQFGGPAPDDAGNSVEAKAEIDQPMVAIGGLDPETQASIGTKSAAAHAASGPPPLSYPKRRDSNKLDVEALPEEYQAALEADDFVIYGQASIEQYDTDDVPTKITMEALEGGLDRYFDSEIAPGIISYGHQDIPVGIPLREYTLEEDAIITQPDGVTHEYDAEETIRSEVRDSDGDGMPELWLASNIANDTEMGKKLRLAALDGDINGYSVTIHRNDDEITDAGRRVTELDLHAVTLGTDEQIKNKGSTFGVAEFKAAAEGTLQNGNDAIEKMAETLLQLMGSNTPEDDDETEQKGAAARLRESLGIDTKEDDDEEYDEKEDYDDDDDHDEKAGEDREDVAQMIASVTDVGVDEAMALLDQLSADGDEQELKGDSDDNASATIDTEAFEAKFEAKADDLGLITEENLGAKLDEKLEDLATTESVEEKLDERLSGLATTEEVEAKMSEAVDAVGEEVDDVMQKARVGTTPDPSADEETTAQRVGDIFGGGDN